MRSAEVLEEKESASRIGVVHVRYVRSERLEQPRHLQIGPNVFLARRRVHHDERATLIQRAEVAPEARVSGSRLDAFRTHSQIARQPFVYKREARVDLWHAASSFSHPRREGAPL